MTAWRSRPRRRSAAGRPSCSSRGCTCSSPRAPASPGEPARSVPLSPEAFQERRRTAWDELEELLRQSRGGALRNQPVQRLERLGTLYRRTASDLAIARRDFAGEPITDYLNSLVARAYPLIHRGRPLRPAAIGDFFARGIPRAFRAHGGYVLLSAALLVAGIA